MTNRRQHGKITSRIAAGAIATGVIYAVVAAWAAHDQAAPACLPIGRTPDPCPARLADLRPTLYYTALETDYPAGSEAAFRDVNGQVLARGSGEFHAMASIEGSARFKDGMVLNYHKRIGDEVRWMPTASITGVDARGCELVPHRTAAVDPTVIPLGSVLMIESTLGMELPDGTRHDGYWIAGDTGEAIIGDRIDLYGGFGIASMSTTRRHGIGHLQAMPVWKVGNLDSCSLPDFEDRSRP